MALLTLKKGHLLRLTTSKLLAVHGKTVWPVIHCFTDGGCVNQGLVNATAVFGYAFRKWKLLFAAWVGACSTIIKFHNLSNCIIDIRTYSYDLILTATTWIHSGLEEQRYNNGWRSKKKCNNIDQLEKILILTT